MMKGPSHRGDIILNVYVSKNTASKYMKEKLRELDGEAEKPPIIGGDFNTPLDN